ncbi:hypothetical protein BG58_18490 [Caballeronia jiangsuensis]|nr:hypothetical protein BG58_18490 [Caballeronia jiangsuensis]
MKFRTVYASIVVGDKKFSAAFGLSTGDLVVSEGAKVIEAIKPPDSWLALASLNRGDGWGTRPTTHDLQTFIERYVMRLTVSGS